MTSKLHKAATVVILATVPFMMSACSDSAHNAESGQGLFQDVINVSIQTSPDKIVLNQPVTINASVSQGGDAVNDAKKVEFEVWKWGDKNHETLKGKHQGEGVYSIEKEFPSEGIYYVIAHVSARGMHNMPRRQLVVGNVSEKEIAQANADPNQSTHEH
ncbi:FixH family protein [Paenibacillus dokdonensis]|uniref:FixH family protein n=1 Tax=Paenibacillus dokdonensis TaxID=2567944 RepID=A0ABU6GJB2_9BACL|nr:FixH family protein [Paenibacillus dokdonensis]MEC0239840.1 FixH family protein [Paenibacillus dokdonensis]